ncbi:diiron oxygenase [Rhodococcus sp. IEGM 1330]|uniref:diiron oxygenase n=1 Tax=Rhodococcus sp. IEGM 1330 TaxID=3082225 RepID=UPI002952D4EA|nr:diiron oxygenase [Rhodococcus sp. IEGM 1330]MDV8022648.1 diiron oxygenase [Rhodococcus sp. IEGM 1330]
MSELQVMSEIAVEDATEVDFSVLKRLNAAWPKRSTLASDIGRLHTDDEFFDPSVPDYPEHFLPFANHPSWIDAGAEQRQKVLTAAWLVYNQRVITAEEEVANPTFQRIAHGTLFGLSGAALREAAQQAHVDETWHTYMHILAMRKTGELRGMDTMPTYPDAVTYRRLVEARAASSGEDENEILDFAWTVVSEISINAYLELLSNDQDIQPYHSLVTRLHARDESAHGAVLIEIAKAAYGAMSEQQRRWFVTALPRALRAFAETDYSVWPIVLSHAGFEDADAIVAEMKNYPGNELLVRDFSGLTRLGRALHIEIEFPE